MKHGLSWQTTSLIHLIDSWLGTGTDPFIISVTLDPTNDLMTNEIITNITYFDSSTTAGLIRTVVSMVHCGCTDRSSILRLDSFSFSVFVSFLYVVFQVRKNFKMVSHIFNFNSATVIINASRRFLILLVDFYDVVSNF